MMKQNGSMQEQGNAIPFIDTNRFLAMPQLEQQRQFMLKGQQNPNNNITEQIGRMLYGSPAY